MTAASFRGHAPAPLALDHAPLQATIREGADAPSGSGTPYVLREGDVFQGSVGTYYDSDWIAVRLTAGQTYTFEMDGITLGDTVLTLVDRYGSSVRYSDDAGALDHSEFTFTPAAGGTYYLVADGFSMRTGSYQISYSSDRPGPGTGPDSLTMTEIARYLTNGFWEDYLRTTRHSFAATAGDTLTCDISDLSAAEQRVARMALSAWTEVTGIRFDTTSGAGAAANIHFVNDVDDDASARVTDYRGSTVRSVHINIDSDWAEGPNQGFDSYFYQTYLHEIGHALGLGHAGPYNGSGTYGVDNGYANDSWQATVMSYFSQTDNTAVHASYAFAVTPMIADIIAIQDLYGATRTVNGTNSVWGEGANIRGAFGMANGLMVSREAVTMTIFDQGGTDWLKLGSDTSAQIINLTGGLVSSVYGLIGNLSIAEGTVIENVVAGQGNDVIRGNVVGNWISGRNGADTIQGFGGNDTLEGGAGADQLVGGMGDDLYVVDALDRLVELAGGGIDRIRATIDFKLADHFEALLLIQSFAKWGTGNDVANTIVGNSQVNYLSGGEGQDTLFGMAGDDTLAGNMGADRLVGGAGDDTYMRDALDTIVEAASGGFDTVMTGDDIILGDHIEKVVVRGGRAVQVTGNAGDNILVGNGARNVLAGGGGQDEMTGGGGADSFVFAAGQGGRILDFQDDIDVLRIEGGAARGLTAATLIAGATERDGGVDLHLAGGLLRIEGITVDGLQDDLLVA